MIQKLSSAQLVEFDRIKKLYTYAKNSNAYSTWFRNAKRNLSFKDGEQWLDEDLNKELKRIGAKRVTQNIIGRTVRNITSIILRLNLRIGYSGLYGTEFDLQLAETIKRWALQVQTENNYDDLLWQQFNDTLCTGIGWLHFTIDDNFKVKIECINALNVFFDPDDTSYRLEAQDFTGFDKWVSIEKLELEYPDKIKFFSDIIDKDNYSLSSNFSNKDDYTTDDETSPQYKCYFGDSATDQWINGRRVKITYIYYRTIDNYYETNVYVDESESFTVPYATFDEEIAKQRSVDGKIIKKKGKRIRLAVFHNNILLDNSPVLAQVPNQELFPLICTVYNKDKDNIPRGAIDDLIPTQWLKNYTITRILQDSKSKLLVMSNEMEDTKMVSDTYKKEADKLYGNLFASDPSKMQIITNEKGLPHVYNLYNSTEKELADTIGLDNQFLSGSGNSSGISKATSAQLAMETQTPTILVAQSGIKTAGRLLYDMIRGMKNFKAVIKTEVKGTTKVELVNDDLLLVDFAVYVDKLSSAPTSFEDARLKVENLLNTPELRHYLFSPMILTKIYNIEEGLSYELSNELTRITHFIINGYQEAPQQQGNMPTNNENINIK